MEPIATDEDSAAMRACAAHGGALCTVVDIDGSWSRRRGAQLAVLPDGTTRGSLADGCLERTLAQEAACGGAPRVLRYGAGSPFVDIRLPCGSGVEVLLDPAPDRAALAAVVAQLDARGAATLELGLGHSRHYIPALRLVVAGSGPEVDALERLALAQGHACETLRPMGENAGTLSLGRAPQLSLDRWTALAVLFHDHEWERGLLPWALASEAFLVGAQGGKGAREARLEWLPPDHAARLRSPIGLLPAARTPSVLALSVLAAVVADYEMMVGS